MGLEPTAYTSRLPDWSLLDSIQFRYETNTIVNIYR